MDTPKSAYADCRIMPTVGVKALLSKEKRAWCSA